MNLDENIEKVENTIKNRKIAIAFSGGADSTLLAYLASKVSDKPIAITIDNHIFPTGFIKHCKKTAKEFGIKHKVIDLNFYEHENLLSNKSDRCFVCRDLMYGNIKKYATDNGYESVVDGNIIFYMFLYCSRMGDGREFLQGKFPCIIAYGNRTDGENFCLCDRYHLAHL